MLESGSHARVHVGSDLLAHARHLLVERSRLALAHLLELGQAPGILLLAEDLDQPIDAGEARAVLADARVDLPREGRLLGVGATLGGALLRRGGFLLASVRGALLLLARFLSSLGRLGLLVLPSVLSALLLLLLLFARLLGALVLLRFRAAPH